MQSLFFNKYVYLCVAELLKKFNKYVRKNK